MKKQLLLLVSGLTVLQCVFAQSPAIEVEKWADKPVLHTLSDEYAKEPAVIIYDKRRIEYIDNTKKEVDEYYTLHKIIHINDDRGIEEFNKIYLGFNENSDVVDVKARSILPGGKIIELDKKNIKDIKEDNGGTYKIFAMEGLEKGCDVEYFYTFKRPATYFGREIIQGGLPVSEVLVQIIAPERLKFDIKPYNFDVIPGDTVLNGKRFAQFTQKETPGAEDEKYSAYSANLKRVEFKLSYNNEVRKGERMFTWNELAKRIYSLYTYFPEKDYKQVADMVRQNQWDALPDEKAKIIAVENYVKKHFSYNEDLKSDEGNNLGRVLHDKIGGTFGTVRLYTAIFTNLNVNYQYVLTGDRTKYVIDRTFENWDNCDYPLFYFPAEKKFIAPTRPDYRYPWILPTWGETNGLFCKRTLLGTFSTAIAEVKNIELEDYTRSAQNLESKIELTKGLDSLTIDAKQIFLGYPAVNFRDAFNFSNEDQKRTLIKELAKSTSNSDNVISSEVLNKEFEDSNSGLPLIIRIKTRSGELLERAGNKLLVKIGLAIGPQVEMYQDKPRQEPVSVDFGHVEERTIEFTVPEGYVINNLNDLNMKQVYEDNGMLTMGFVSGYEMKGNVLKVHIVEEYRKTYYPLSQFDQFRKIINASSDFNKVVLVLQKKS